MELCTYDLCTLLCYISIFLSLQKISCSKIIKFYIEENSLFPPSGFFILVLDKIQAKRNT